MEYATAPSKCSLTSYDVYFSSIRFSSSFLTRAPRFVGIYETPSFDSRVEIKEICPFRGIMKRKIISLLKFNFIVPALEKFSWHDKSLLHVS